MHFAIPVCYCCSYNVHFIFSGISCERDKGVLILDHVFHTLFSSSHGRVFIFIEFFVFIEMHLNILISFCSIFCFSFNVVVFCPFPLESHCLVSNTILLIHLFYYPSQIRSPGIKRLPIFPSEVFMLMNFTFV